MPPKFICSMCSHRSFCQLNVYLLHVRIRHASDPCFSVVCGIAGCLREYHKYASFVKHIARKHNGLVCSSRVRDDSEINHRDDALYDEMQDEDEGTRGAPAKPIDFVRSRAEQCSNLRQSMLRYSLKLREKHLLPATVHSDIIQECTSMITDTLTAHHELLSNFLLAKGYNVQDDVELKNIMDTSDYAKLLENCGSAYRLANECRNNLGMICPKLHAVGPYKGYYVPVTDVLKKLLQKEDVAAHVLQPTDLSHADTDRMTNFMSSEALKEISSLKRSGHLLLIHLYNDEFDVVNPIGAKRGKHKLNATYLTLGNLPSKYRSNLQHIHLAIMIKHKAVKEFGYAAVFAPLVHELQALFSEGFCVEIDGGRVEKFFGVLCTVSGDNLSSHGLGGFRQVFNSGRVCRMCMVSHKELPDKMHEQHVVLRNAKNHAYHVQAVNENPDNIAIYGVQGPSVFSSLEYFDVIRAFPPDIMHDCLEGIVPRVTEAIVQRLVHEKSITILQLNQNIANFKFQGHDRVNKPELFKPNGAVVGSAAQKLCLFLFLPFFVDFSKYKVARQMYCLTREVIMYAFSRQISRADLDYFAQRIEAFHNFIKEHFSTIRITPKFHFLIHYPTMMVRYGPLRELWCMRFEAKHQYFKALASSLGNFINIAFTLASRHQMLQCYLFSGSKALHEDVVLPNSGKFVAFTSLPIDVQRRSCFANGSTWSVKEATVDTSSYCVGAAIIIDFTDDCDPVFLKITHLLIPHEGHVDIIGKLLIPVSFSNNFYAYEVQDNGWGHCHPGAEKDCALLWPVEMKSGVYISLPYYIPSWSGTH